ncbi:MAG: tyrosine--tRNA ligase [Patescibacteria group bacterium]
MKLSEVLTDRGFVHQITGTSLSEIVDGTPRVAYLGVDPTADSLHVGNLVIYMMLRHFVAAGHRVVLLVGGGTGLIGDPKSSEERPLIEKDVVEMRVGKLTQQVKRLINGDIEVVNNADWLTRISLIDFLRDTGKFFTVNALIKKEIMQKRLAAEVPLSYTEFAYPLLQAYDYLHLHQSKSVDLQVGGSDQWGNITAGVELIHKKLGHAVHALTVPLVIDKVSGKKFGKSEGNAVWLDPEKTSPFSFFQFWLNTDDANVFDYLKLYTLLSLDKINGLQEKNHAAPHERTAQYALAHAVTEIVHGKAQADTCVRVSEILFGNLALSELGELDHEVLLESAPRIQVTLGMFVADVLMTAGFARSKREARQFILDGAVQLGGIVCKEADAKLEAHSFSNNLVLLKRGKRLSTLLTLV